MDIKNFMLGVNYWDSEHGTDMWAKYDHDIVENDLRVMKECGVKWMRVFPNWRDFQPVCRLRTWRGGHRQYRWTGDRLITTESGIVPEMLEHFRDFCDTAEKYGISLVVSVLTGWMSARLFCPPALENLNLLKDPESLMWSERFVRGFVEATKDHNAIKAWDLGNECNCLGNANHAEAVTWTALIRNTIKAADSSRIIMSGMHSLEAEDWNTPWQIADQATYCDILTPHPYPSSTIGTDVTPMNSPRTTMLPSAQLVYYSTVGNKPAMIQEQGTFSQMLANKNMGADFVRANLFSSLAHGSRGYLYWCGFEHLKLKNPPYTWAMCERELGLVDVDKKPKPAAYEIQKMGKLLEALPFSELPERDIDVVCVTTSGNDQWKCVASAFVMGKQAGFEIAVRHHMQTIPEADIYMIPSISGWNAMEAETYEWILDRVKNHGATLYISVDDGILSTFEDVSGLISMGFVKNSDTVNAEFNINGKVLKFEYNNRTKLLAESIGAEVIGKSGDNVLYSKNKYGKGYVYLLGMPLEKLAYDNNWYDDSTEYYKIYEAFASDVIKSKIVRSNEKFVGVTQHKKDDGSYIIIAVNYNNTAVNPQLIVKDGWTLIPVYGDDKEIGACAGAIFEAVKI